MCSHTIKSAHYFVFLCACTCMYILTLPVHFLLCIIVYYIGNKTVIEIDMQNVNKRTELKYQNQLIKWDGNTILILIAVIGLSCSTLEI